MRYEQGNDISWTALARNLGIVMTRSFDQQKGQPLENKIYVFRKQKNWTLKQLSELSGVPFNTVWRIENGYGTGLKNAYKIASVFQTTIYELWDIPPSGMTPTALGRTKTFSPAELRFHRGWVLDQLAELSGVSKATLSHVERGHIPVLENAVRIARAFGVSVYEIWKP